MYTIGLMITDQGQMGLKSKKIFNKDLKLICSEIEWMFAKWTCFN